MPISDKEYADTLKRHADELRAADIRRQDDLREADQRTQSMERVLTQRAVETLAKATAAGIDKNRVGWATLTAVISILVAIVAIIVNRH